MAISGTEDNPLASISGVDIGSGDECFSNARLVLAGKFWEARLPDYKDADIVRYITDSPRLSSCSSVSLLSANLVSKECQPGLIEDTLQAMEVARQLGIRVPTVKRVVYFEGMVYLIIERVDGVSLEKAWNKLGWIKSLRLALELRGYIRSLR
uniref:Aminoglycoside phosphotransferase domain-containing protein n=1 Tax=Coccidioides posadasii RMSCC 3488 TaxID=454284 RepID=A0A0J6F2B9_COCPO|nr:hypothetical protein CPAG_03377 [Coccidioides posadasii RMSCC 3488]